LVRLRPDRGQFLDGLSFSLFTYRTGELDAGPVLPPHLSVNLAIVGAGAIGNALVAILRDVPLTGPLSVIDPQIFGPENLATCVLIGPGDVARPKAALLAGQLAPAIDARPYVEPLKAFERRLGRELPWPSVVLGAVDNIDARHAIQGLWPDLVIDGATGDFGCQVSRHPSDGDEACVMCLFRHPDSESAETVGSRLTGLPAHRVRDGLSALTEADVASAPEEKRFALRAHVGRPVCTVVAAIVAQALSEERQRAGFEPSIPFTAGLSAAMMIGELVKSAGGLGTTLETRFQLDMLRGPEFGQMCPQSRRADCLCVTRRRNVERVRSARRCGVVEVGKTACAGLGPSPCA
jgi:molybdopterin/thiamine biosynthesis adenylyltransferase